MMNRKWLRKANVLKQFEVYGYQITYYLLRNEAMAEQAARRALMELFQDDDFFAQPLPCQKRIMKRVFAKHAMQYQLASAVECQKEMA